MGHKRSLSVQRPGRPFYLACRHHISFRIAPTDLSLSQHCYDSTSVMVLLRARLGDTISDEMWARVDLKIYEAALISRPSREYTVRPRIHACWLCEDRRSVVICAELKLPLDDLPRMSFEPDRHNRLDHEENVRIMGEFVVRGVIYGKDPSRQLVFYVDREIRRMKPGKATPIDKCKRLISKFGRHVSRHIFNYAGQVEPP